MGVVVSTDVGYAMRAARAALELEELYVEWHGAQLDRDSVLEHALLEAIAAQATTAAQLVAVRAAKDAEAVRAGVTPIAAYPGSR